LILVVIFQFFGSITDALVSINPEIISSWRYSSIKTWPNNEGVSRSVGRRRRNRPR